MVNVAADSRFSHSIALLQNLFFFFLRLFGKGSITGVEPNIVSFIVFNFIAAVISKIN